MWLSDLRTWVYVHFPIFKHLLRIDYILHSSEFQGVDYFSPDLEYSDHNPVVDENEVIKPYAVYHYIEGYKKSQLTHYELTGFPLKLKSFFFNFKNLY